MADFDPLVLAYLAGVVDSDGYITITRTPRAQSTYYAARIGIAGTRSASHELAAKTFGGTVRCYDNRDNRPQYQWHRVGPAAAVAIEAVAPFLRVKREQAVLALRLQLHVSAGEQSIEALAEREAMHQSMVLDLNEWRRRRVVA